MTARDNNKKAEDFMGKLRRNLPAVAAAGVTYVVTLFATCGWVAKTADTSQSLISSKSITLEQIKAMSSLGYWLGKVWLLSIIAVAALIFVLIKAAGDKKASAVKAAAIAGLSPVAAILFRGWNVVSKAALFQSLLGNWTTIVALVAVAWLIRKFWPKIKGFFSPPKDDSKEESEEETEEPEKEEELEPEEEAEKPKLKVQVKKKGVKK